MITMNTRPFNSLWPLPLVTPAQGGLCDKRLKNVSTYLDRLIEEGVLAGALTLIARHGGIAYQRCHGFLDVDQNIPMRPDAIFRLYSMTKPVVSVVTLMLVEEGLLALNDPVSLFFPEFAHLQVAEGGSEESPCLVPLKRPITIHDLLTHTSGLTYPFNLCFNYPGDSAHFIDAICKIPLAEQPGKKWIYSAAQDVLGCLIEKVTGQRLDEVFAERVFRPLGMEDTGFTVPAEKRDRFSALYQHDEQMRIVQREDNDQPYFGQPIFLSGGSGLVGTTADYLRFCLMLLRGGEFNGVRLLCRKTVELMRQDHLPSGYPTIEPFNFGYGYGVAVIRSLAEKKDLCSVGEFGWGGAAGTNAWIDPVEEMVSMVMFQIYPSKISMIDHRVKTLFTQAIVD